MPILLYFTQPLTKSFIPAHTRKTKDGKIIQVAAYSDKRLRKDAQAVTHNKDINHLSEDDRANWERLHKEQHVLHHVDKATHERRIKEYAANIEHHKKKAAHHEAQRDLARANGDSAALSEHNKALTHHHNRAQAWINKLAPHERQLAKLNKKLDGIKAMKEKLWAGSGEVGAKEPAKNLSESASPKDGERNADGLVFRDGRWHREDGTASPKITPTGKTNEVKTAKGTKVNTQFAVVEASDLTTSHDASGNANPAYPSELQPRNRGRDTSQAQTFHNSHPRPIQQTRNQPVRTGQPR